MNIIIRQILPHLRYLIDHYDPGFWEETIYNYWLNSIRYLNPPTDRSTLPQFMQTAAYWQQKMNTQLASWTELRHDNLLYAKQSYTGGTICSYPFSFVEPFPEFFNNLKLLAQDSYTYFNSLSFPDPLIKAMITEYFSSFIFTADTLTSIAQKELNGETFTPEEIYFLKTMLYDDPTGSGDPFLGWYPKLFYRDHEYELNKGLMESDHIVADIHTTPTDCGGGVIGAISHVGTGKVNVGIVVTENHEGNLTAFAGPVMSYYDYRTYDFLRLTDEEWANTHLQSALRPDWVNIYLADSLGNSRGEGASLITLIADDDNLPIPQTEILISNYPNPFNPSTIIAFTIPYDLTNSQTELKIYDLQGRLIKTLVNEVLAAGNYLSKWNGTNENGVQVSSGVYIYNIEVAYKQKSGKMTLLK